MPHRPVRLLARVRLTLPVLLLLLSGCGGQLGRGPAEGFTVGVESRPAEADVFPSLPVVQVETVTGPLRTVQRLEVVDEDLRVVLRSLAESFGMDYHIDSAVTGRVTARLQSASLEQVLNELVLPQGYAYQIEGTVLRVAPATVQARTFSLDYISLSRTGVGTTLIQRRLGQSGGGAGDLGLQQFGGQLAAAGADIIQSVSVYDLWAELRISLEGLIFSESALAAADPGLSPGGVVVGSLPSARASGAYSRSDAQGNRLILNPLSGTILVSAPPATLAQVEAFIATVEGSVQRQVLIEARIVEVSLNRRSEFGIDWNVLGRLGHLEVAVGSGTGGAEFRLARSEEPTVNQVNVVLRALQQQGDVHVLSSPRVSVLNNQRAVINVATDEIFFSVTRQPVIGPDGRTIGFTTEVDPQQISVGIVLDVFAQISSENTITMNVRPVITNVLEVRELRLDDGTLVTAPVIDRRETDTVVRVRGGETIVIGGLIQTSRRRSSSGVPVLREVPFLGALFGGSTRNDERRELVIFLTPTIVAGQPPIGS